MIRWLLLILAVTLLAALGLWLDHRSRPPASDSLTPQESNVIYASGRVEGATPEIALRLEISGRIAEVCVHEGDVVSAGTLLLRLDAAAAQQQVARMQAEWSLADALRLRLENGAHEQERIEVKAIWDGKLAELKRAQTTWERSVQLEGKASVSLQDLDNQRGEMDVLTSQVSAARARWEFLNAPPRKEELQIAEARCAAAAADLQLAKIQLAKTELRAPTQGQVLKLDCEIGELTGPEVAEPPVLLADTRKIRVRAFVEELDARRIRVGQSARILITDESESSLLGTVVELAPRMSRKQSWSDQPDERFDLKSREVVIELSSAGELPVGLFVDVEILSPQETGIRPGDVSVGGDASANESNLGFTTVSAGRVRSTKNALDQDLSDGATSFFRVP
jgi:multidrug resistance efflux pump